MLAFIELHNKCLEANIFIFSTFVHIFNVSDTFVFLCSALNINRNINNKAEKLIKNIIKPKLNYHCIHMSYHMLYTYINTYIKGRVGHILIENQTMHFVKVKQNVNKFV